MRCKIWPSMGVVLWAALAMSAAGCSSETKPLAHTTETTVTVEFDDGRREAVPLSKLDETAAERTGIKGILATDRQTRQAVVITLEEAKKLHPSTGKYVILQSVPPPKAEQKP
ncbi:MAG: hypothetical protein ACKVT0_00775 [Planctomycetaceae bacterium]